MMFRQVFDIGVAGQKPQQFVDDSLKKHFPGRHQGEALRQIKAQLRAEEALGPRARAVPPDHALIEDALQKIEVLSHTARINVFGPVANAGRLS
jgi:hypothetical protein